jgi:hypothetical protein
MFEFAQLVRWNDWLESNRKQKWKTLQRRY